MTSAAEAALSRVCLACGLCCDGTLFTHIMPVGDELVTLAGTQVRLRERKDGVVVIDLPCPALAGKCCGMYQARPAGCRAFVCKTGRALLEGHLDEAAALARVHEAQARLRAVEAALPPAARQTPGPVIRLARTHGLLDGPGPLRRLDEWLDQHFRA